MVNCSEQINFDNKNIEGIITQYPNLYKKLCILIISDFKLIIKNP